MQGNACRGLLLALTAAGVLALPAAAAATPMISVSGTALTIVGDDGPNAILETSSDPTSPWFTSPGGQPLGAGPGCTQVTDTDVSCNLPAGGSANVALGAGDDTLIWWPTSIPVTVDGGPGDDEITGGSGNDVLHGGAGDDTITGYGGDDLIYGDGGDDDLDGSSGSDTIDGGPGRDNINGDGSGDSDWVSTALRYGNDLLLAKDGEQDKVFCEGGSDVAVVDKGLDNVAGDCETVTDTIPSGNKAGAPAPGGNPGSTVKPPAGGASKQKLTLRLRRGKLPTLRALAAGRPLTLTIAANRTCTASTSLRTAPGARLATHRNRVAAGRQLKLKLTVAPRARRTLRTRKRSLKARITVSCTTGSERAVRRMALTIRR